MRSDAERDTRPWTVQQQTVYDPVSGLIIQFKVGEDGLPRLRLLGKSLPYGNREIGFGTDGREAFAGIVLAGDCGLPESPLEQD